MIRVVGVLCGSAIAIAVLIVALGLPQLVEPTVETIPEEEQHDVADASPAPDATVHDSAEPPVAIEVEQVPEMPVAAQPEPAVEALADPEVATANATPEQNWFAFWSPFRSELAANGFISELQRTTGMDYRVVRLKPGVYEVAFAYGANEDIDAKLAAITAATGLEMPGG